MKYEDDEFISDESHVALLITIAIMAALAVLAVAVWMIIGGLG